jgi:hypothetical protein
MTKKIVKTVMLFAVVILAGCATQISLTVQRTPTLNTTGIRRIAIMPFEANGYQNAARRATSVAEAIIQATNHFTLVSASEIQHLRQTGQSIESHIDALFTGRITRIGQETTSGSYETTNRQTGVTTTHYWYQRDVEVELSYSLGET